MVMRFLAKLLLLVTLTRHGMPFAIIDVCTRVRGGASVAQTMTTGNQTSVSMSVNIGHPSIPDPSEVCEDQKYSNINSLTSDQRKGPLKVLFLSADTGGGHRASAESLAKQFLLHYPGSSYDLLDVWTPCGVLPYRGLVNFYKHLYENPCSRVSHVLLTSSQQVGQSKPVENIVSRFQYASLGNLDRYP